jgi:protein TonB
MNLAYRSAGGALAIALYVGAFFILSAPEVISAGDAVADGDAGNTAGLGRLGAYAETSERLQQAIAPPPPPEPPVEVPKVKPPEPVVEDVPKYQAPKPEKTPEKEPEKTPEEVTPEPVEETPETVTPTEQKQDASTAMQKATGHSEQQSSGGQRGNAKSYIRDLYKWLARHRTYPPAAKKSKQQGTVMLAFTVNRNGDVLRSSVQKSSGYPLLDEAALRMLEKATPVPAVPEDFYPSRTELPLVMPIEFSLITNSSFGE